MATIVERTTGRGERRLYVTFRAIDRKSGKRRQVWELCPTPLKKDANRLRADIESGLGRSGGYWPLEELAPPSTTVGAYICEWLVDRALQRLDDGKVTPRVFAAYCENARRYLYPALADIELADLTTGRIIDLMHELAGRGMAKNSIRNNVLSPLRRILNTAAKEERIPSNPAVGIEDDDIPGRAPKEPKAPTPDELRRILAHASDDARDVIQVAASQALGIGEVFGLRWRNVGTTTLDIEAQNYRGVIVDRTKTKTRRRRLPLFPTAKAVLDARRERLTWERSVHALPWEDQPVFADALGRPENPDNWRKREWDTALERAGLVDVGDDGKPRPRFDFHELRKYASAELRKQAADDRLRKQMLGHAANSSVTDTIYTPLDDDALASAALAFDPLVVAR